MAVKKPLANYGGQIAELAAGDTVSGAVAGVPNQTPYTAVEGDRVQANPAVLFPGTLNGWTSAYGTGTIVADTADTPVGSGSLSITTTSVSGSNDAAARSPVYGTPLNWTGKHVRVVCKISAQQKLSDLILYVTSDGFASFATARLVQATPPNNPIAEDGEWATYTFSQADFAGSVNWGSINQMQFRVSDLLTGAVTVKIAAIFTVPKPANGMLSLTFDDGWLDQYTVARPAMDLYGYPGTAYLIRDLIDANSLYMTTDQLKRLQNVNGWEIASHADTVSAHNAGYAGMTAAALDQEFSAMRSWSIQNGFRGGQDFAYPLGKYDATVLDAMRRHFASGRTIYRDPPRETLTGVNDPYRLRAWSVASTDTLATVQAAVNRAAINGEWLILVFHRFAATPVVDTQWKPADFQALMASVSSSGILVRTVGDALDLVNRVGAGGATDLAPLSRRLKVLESVASANAAAAVTGQYYDNAMTATASATVVATAGFILLAPFFVAEDTAIDQIGVAVSVAAAGAARALVYGSGTDRWPDQLLLSVDITSTGSVAYAGGVCSFIFQAGVQYWIGVHTAASPTLRAIPVGSASSLGLASNAGTTYNALLRRAVSFASGPPQTWGFTSIDRNATLNPPSIRYRAAAPLS